MSKRNDFIWKAIQTICWLIFAGYCIQSGTLLFNYIYSLFSPIATHNLHLGLNLSELYSKSIVIYSLTFSIIIVVSTLKAYLLFITLRLFKELNLANPFSDNVRSIIAKITYYTFSIGLLSLIVEHFFKKLLLKGFQLGEVEKYVNDGGAYLVMSAILFLIAMIFQKGIELQNENDLTI